MHAVKMADNGSQQQSKRGRKAATMANSEAILEGLTEMVRGTLHAVLNADQVDKAMAAAEKRPAFKAMVATITKAKGKGGKGPKEAGPKAIRSTYVAFTSVAMAHLKAADRAELANMTLVGQTWKKLPAAIRSKVEERLNHFRDRYNASLAAGKSVGSLPDELAKYERESRLDPLDFTQFIARYKDYPVQEQLTKSPKLKDKAEVPAAAAGEKRKAADGDTNGNGHHKKEKKEKKHHHKAPKEKKEKK